MKLEYKCLFIILISVLVLCSIPFVYISIVPDHAIAPGPRPIYIYGENTNVPPIKAVGDAFTQKYGIDVDIDEYNGITDPKFGVYDSDSMAIWCVNDTVSDIGLLSRELTLNETALGLRQIVVAYNGTTGTPILFTIKGEPGGNTSTFINFTLSDEGQSILASHNYKQVKYNST